MAKILLVEDDRMLAEMYVDKFSQAGHETDAFVMAEEAIEYLKKNKPDLIILDMVLPKGNGVWFLEELQKLTKISTIPVVGLSNYDNPETKRDAFRFGLREYLIKANFTPQELLDKLKKYLEFK